MGDAARHQLEEALAAASASGNVAVLGHIKAALALFGPGEGQPRGPRDADQPDEDDGGAAAAKSPRLAKATSKASRDPRLQPKGSPASKLRKSSQSNLKPGEESYAEQDAMRSGAIDEDKEGSKSGTAKPLKPKPIDKGEGPYAALLHSMGGGKAQKKRVAEEEEEERVPPKRLSSFVNNAVSKGQLPPGPKMATHPPGPMHRSEQAGDVELSAPFARKAVIRQNSSLGDSILNHRSLLGTANPGTRQGFIPSQLGPHGQGRSPAYPNLQPQQPEPMEPMRRLPMRTATGINSYQRRPAPGPMDFHSHAELQAAMRAASNSRQHLMGPRPKVMWSGTIKHNASGNMVELCTLMCMLPHEVIDHFPATLFINDLVLRDQVQLNRHVLLNCSMQEPSIEQRQNLAMMSQMKLTGVIKLQHCEFTLCPVLADHGDIRIMGFLLVN